MTASPTLTALRRTLPMAPEVFPACAGLMRAARRLGAALGTDAARQDPEDFVWRPTRRMQ